jgi:Domain of unknown function (DUF4350)
VSTPGTTHAATRPTATRQWRLPIAIAGIVLIGGAIIAWLQPAGPPTAYLDPGNVGPDGGHALAAILSQRGEQLTAATTAATAEAQASATGSSGTTILVTSPQLLTAAQLDSLRGSTADLVLTDPDQAELSALAPDVAVTDQEPSAAVNPDCGLSAATLAGNADLGGTLLTTTATNAQRCYPVDGHPSLVSYQSGGRRITVLGTADPLTNAELGNLGNAALAMNLLGDQPRLVWLTPSGVPQTGPVNSGGQATFTSLIPKPVYMVAVQLVIVVLLLALWRVRRLGPVVAERLPAVVRAAETTEGHGRLYHARRARDRAAQALRDAATSRMLPRLGLPPDADQDVIAAVLAARTGEPATGVGQTLSGLPPKDDAALVALADKLDELERKAGAR